MVSVTRNGLLQGNSPHNECKEAQMERFLKLRAKKTKTRTEYQ